MCGQDFTRVYRLKYMYIVTSKFVLIQFANGSDQGCSHGIIMHSCYMVNAVQAVQQ